MTTDPAWVIAEREAKALEGLKHVPGQAMTRCEKCWNLSPYCSCESLSVIGESEISVISEQREQGDMPEGYSEGLRTVWVDNKEICSTCRNPTEEEGFSVPCCGPPYECVDFNAMNRCDTCKLVSYDW